MGDLKRPCPHCGVDASEIIAIVDEHVEPSKAATAESSIYDDGYSDALNDIRSALFDALTDGKAPTQT